MKIELTADQGQALINLLNIAVKSGGLEVADDVMFFVRLIQKGYQDDLPAVVDIVADGEAPA